MEDQLLKRILRKFRMERAFSVMSEQMKRHQLITFLMGLAARRSRSVSPADVLLQMDDDRFLGASIVSQRDFHAVDAVAFRLARAFEAVDSLLSPPWEFAVR